MITSPGLSLGYLAMKLLTEIAPSASTEYDAANTNLIAALMIALAQDSGRALDNRLKDIAAIAELIGRAPQSGVTFDAQPPAAYTLDAIKPLHDEALDALIDLHAWAEANDAELNAAVWTFLADHAERNRFDIDF